MLILLAEFDNGMVLSLQLCFANLVPKKNVVLFLENRLKNFHNPIDYLIYR